MSRFTIIFNGDEMKYIKRFFKFVVRDWWVVKRGCFPYSGYCTYNPLRRMILDTGLTKEHAQEICNNMNRGASS